ncbi:MAG: hypothetical protein QOK04_730, partial [Solirubrobacteraceae bacterium]|nr:hypothetical protein [Solirubrobacteraceae bacterium]
MSLFDRKQERRERTEDERERARAERESRRAGRTGEPAAVYDGGTAAPEMNSTPPADGNPGSGANEANVRTGYPAAESFIDEPVSDDWAEVDEPAPAPRRARRAAGRRPPGAGGPPPGRGRRRA